MDLWVSDLWSFILVFEGLVPYVLIFLTHQHHLLIFTCTITSTTTTTLTVPCTHLSVSPLLMSTHAHYHRS